MDRIVSRRSWIVVLTGLLLSAAVLAATPPSGRSTQGSEAKASRPPALPGESVYGGAPTTPSRELSLEQRVAYQRRIEEVHWRHTTWPDVNPKPKPPLAEVLSDAAIRAKVDDALRKSAALERHWQRPIMAEQLQAEMERMARGTRHPERLRELFATLDDDPFVIAECLARPALADRLLRNWYASDERFHGAVRAAAESALAGGVTASSLPTAAARYEEVVFELERDRTDATVADVAPSPGQARAVRFDGEEWSEEVWRLAGWFGARGTALPEAGKARATVSEAAGPTDDGLAALYAAIPVGGVSALEESVDGWRAVTVLAKARGSVRLGIAEWPKRAFSTWWSASRDDLQSSPGPVAGTYTLPTVSAKTRCTPDSWRISLQGAPAARSGHTAVWTGDRMIVWGGVGYSGNTGGMYDPATDSWTPTSVEGAPSARVGHTAVWTGDRMIVWGAVGLYSGAFDTGGVYDPATDAWTPTPVEGAPAARNYHSAVWTGDRMIVWGGSTSNGSPLNTGGAYDPATGDWTPTAVAGAPSARYGHTAVWTGDRMIVWGGGPSTGGVYDPTTDSWIPTSNLGAPSAPSGHTAVWAGNRMIVWGGWYSGGGMYDPTTDSWTPTSRVGAPTARYGYTAVWTCDRMIVWGGSTNTGSAYDPATDHWSPTSVEGAPSARSSHTAVWTGDRMIVWGGSDTNTGGVYNPATDRWTPTLVGGAPSARAGHTAVWTGDRMIVWGGSGYYSLNVGGLYDPVTDSWTPTSVEGAPIGSSNHSAVWTGDRMIVWAGYDGSYNLNTGGVYDPSTDRWEPTSVVGAPSARRYHTAIWTGDRMIVWGGYDSFSNLNTGGEYDLSTDRWEPTPFEGAPSARRHHTAIWTGDRMIVWGGEFSRLSYYNTGGVFDTVTERWTPTSVGSAPSARAGHTAVWTGGRMIVWGGSGYSSLSIGGLYDPVTDRWTPTSVEGAPSARSGHTAVWTGDRMIAWGGYDSFYRYFNTGGVYDPTTDSWTPTSVEGAPYARRAHTSVYTGSAMLSWGGVPYSNELGAYCAAAPNQAPRAAAGPDQALECTGAGATMAVLDGSNSSDPDSTAGTNDDIVLFEWFEDLGSAGEALLGTGTTLTVDLSLGDHVITLRVTDGAGATGTDEVVVQVVDTIPPVITLANPLDRARILPTGLPFSVVFTSSDACCVRREVVTLAGCPIYDGFTYGDGDGLLSDEALQLDRAELCRVASLCNFTALHQPELRVEATDCGGNVGIASRTILASVALLPGLCQPQRFGR